MHKGFLPIPCLFLFVVACGASPANDEAPVDSVESAAVSATWSRVLVSGAFHIGGGNNFRAMYVDESNIAQIEAGHAGEWANPDWIDPYDRGQIHFSQQDLAPSGGLVLMERHSLTRIAGTYDITYTCSSSIDQTLHSDYQTTSTNHNIFVPLTCPSGSLPTFFRGWVTMRNAAAPAP